MYLFIVNPQAGGGAGRKAWKRAERLLAGRAIAYEALMTTGPQQAADETERALRRRSWQAAVVVGGDGTLHSVLEPIARSGVPLGIVPAGSGNDTARGFGIPFGTEAALGHALGQAVRPADLLQGPGGLAATAFACGFDAQVALNVNASFYKKACNRLKAGRLAYLIGVLHTLLTYKPGQAVIEVDGESRRYDKVWLVSVCNLPSYGGGLLIAPQADGADGLLDVCIVHGASRFQLLRLFPTVLKGRHTALPFVSMLRGREVSAAFAQPRPVIGDGEPALGPLNVRCEAAALTIAAPEAAV